MYSSEYKRHRNLMEKINHANNLSDFKRIHTISLNSIKKRIKEIADENLHDYNIISEHMNPIFDSLYIDGINSDNFKCVVQRTLHLNYYAISKNEINNFTEALIKDVKLYYLIKEYETGRLKKGQLEDIKLDKEHQETIEDINTCYDIKLLPDIYYGDITRRIARDINEIWNPDNFKVSEIPEIISYYMNNNCTLANRDELTKLVINLIEKYYDDVYIHGDWRTGCEMIATNIITDKKLEYLKLEYFAKEARKLFIYKNDHQETMENIKEAKRISQLPSNLSSSVLTSYLFSNSTIYTRENNTKLEDFKYLTTLLLSGYKWETKIVNDALVEICEKRYKDRKDAYELLRNKLVSLPKTYYLAEEIKAYYLKQDELIKNKKHPVNIYFVENKKSPINGGRFYNVYISRRERLDLDVIIPEDMDVDVIEAFIQEKYDPTFKLAGGIILMRDETIGSVSVFKPSNGKVEVSIQEKNKLDTIDNLDKQILESEEKLKRITEFKEHANGMLSIYEQQVLTMQQNFINEIEEFKKTLGEDSNLLILKPE